ncbi:B3 domain-containing transcription factor VRN1-like isoform X2 [Primulina eburnea]|uniref:B3 domain-containing transcription factor VRN1-like isoform X2 n=1 Tax=Primulina eburnea TaxID=1245227 RepID=UPI003C6CA8CD
MHLTRYISSPKPTGMTSDYGLKKGDESGSSGSGIGTKFFKIVSNPGAHKLRLPPEFTRRCGHNLPDRVSLEVPNGLVWKVELTHSDGEAWLQGGWQRFEEYYSIRLGHFLLFKYVGDSHFEVNIFDTSATEIEYSYYDSLERDVGVNQVAETEVVECESDDSVVFLKEIFAGKNVSSLDSSPNHRSDIELKYPDRKQVEQQARYGYDKCKAYKRALDFMSEKPNENRFTILVMHPSYVCTGRSALHISLEFAKEILVGTGNISILLVCEGKTWPVRCICRKRRVSFTTGWRKFVADNNLKVDDVCVLQVSKMIDNAFEVIIFRD